MATATISRVWTGRSGRTYVPAERGGVRHGGTATVRRVVAQGAPVGRSEVAADVPVALKLWNEGDETSLEHLQQEARVLEELSDAQGDLPCPQLFDVVGSPLVTGIVMEWCPADLERWWRGRMGEPDALGHLLDVLAEVARRASDYHVFYAKRQGAHGDLKPSNILLSQEGRWLISDFGTARVTPKDTDAYAETRVLGMTENFVAPEVLFGCKIRHPSAMDTWSLGATLYALLRMKRMADDGAALPKNGTHSPRFQTERLQQIREIYGKDPTRFVERDLDATAFSSPLKLPEQDARALRDALNGTMPGADAETHEELAAGVIEVVERCLSIDPKHRYTTCRDLAAALENLTRQVIALSVRTGQPAPEREAVAPEREATGALVSELRSARDRIDELEQSLLVAQAQAAKPGAVRAFKPPVWWAALWIATLLVQLFTLFVALVVLALVLGTV